MNKKDTALKEWRLAHHLTVREVADLTGMSASEISRAERGLVELPALRKVEVARSLGTSIAELFPKEADDG